MSAETSVDVISPGDARRPVPACTYFGEGDEQAPFDIAVVIPTLGRPVLAEALECIFRQDIPGRIQVLIGFDTSGAIPDFFFPILDRRPANVSVVMLHLPYSTARRHGGPHLSGDGGALRTILSYMANSRYVAYLDDDNYWAPSHLRLLRQAVEGKAYAFAPRMLIDEESGRRIGVDVWDSVGPGKGRMAADGGFVDPNCLVVDKIAVGVTLGRWAQSIRVGDRISSDRWFFSGISKMPFGSIDQPTVEYKIRSTNVLQRLAKDNAPASG